MARYRKRPVEIEAVQLRWTQWNEVCELLGDALTAENSDGAWEIPAAEASDTCGEEGPNYIALNVRTTHGEIAIVRHGDWIVPENEPGRFYPVKPDIFAATYEAVARDSAATEATELEKTARVFAGLHRSAEADVTRVIDLYEQWVKAGPPPLGTPLSRWWDARLVELHDAIRPDA